MSSLQSLAERTHALRPTKIRLFLNPDDDRPPVYIAWFTLDDVDLYWGLSRPSIDTATEMKIAGREVTIELPESLDGLPTAIWKASWHASGNRHVTAGGSGSLRIADAYVGNVESLAGPTFLGALLLAPPAKLPAHKGTLNKGNGRSISLHVDSSWWNTRVYIDLHVSPAGTFPMPPPLLSGATRELPIVAVSVDAPKDLVLLVRAAPIAGPFANWRTDASIVFLPDRHGIQTRGDATEPAV